MGYSLSRGFRMGKSLREAVRRVLRRMGPVRSRRAGGSKGRRWSMPSEELKAIRRVWRTQGWLLSSVSDVGLEGSYRRLSVSDPASFESLRLKMEEEHWSAQALSVPGS